jgi:3-isopropylmalate/(R)-2-methylmalate dehydratase small subunit
MIGPLRGRAWVFPEPNLDTDLMMPGTTFRLAYEEQVKLVFSANRPGWNELVQPGDIVVAGLNFGTGSARPAPALLRRLGVAAIVAESFSDLFFRNCVNYAMPALPCAGITAAVAEGDVVEVDLTSGKVRLPATGVELAGVAMPGMLIEIIEFGGLMSRLRKLGYIA